MLSQSPPIQIKNLNKIYRDGTRALENINMSVREGEIFVMLGPNGAGKTTLINIICGLTNRTSGEVYVFGNDVTKNYQLSRGYIGLVPQELSSEPYLTVRKAVEFQAGYFGIRASKSDIENLLEKLSLLPKIDVRVRFLSGGMKRRLMIAKALIHHPKILFLDEPSAGVDVELRRDIWEFITTLKQSGTTIILTTHYLEEAEAMADQVSIIDNGKIVITENKTKLVENFGKKKFLFYFSKKMEAIPHNLKKYDCVLLDEGRILEWQNVHASELEEMKNVISILMKEGYDIIDMESRQPRLEEIFVDFIHKNNKRA